MMNENQGKWQKIWAFLKNPPIWFVISCALPTVALIALSLVAVALGWTNPVIYGVFGLTAVGFGYCVFLVVRCLPTWKRSFREQMRKSAFMERLMTDYPYRTRFFAVCSLAFNIAYAAFEVVLCVLTGSFWFITLGIYYAALAFLRYGVTVGHGRKTRRETAEGKARRELLTYRFCGGLLLFLALAMSGLIVFMVRDGRGFEYVGLTIFAAAAYTFFRAVSSIINLVKARKYEDPVVQAARNINLAGAAMSILGLQTAMFSAFGAEMKAGTVALMNALTGAGVCAVTAVLGIVMLVSANRKLKEKGNGNARE